MDIAYHLSLASALFHNSIQLSSFSRSNLLAKPALAHNFLKKTKRPLFIPEKKQNAGLALKKKHSASIALKRKGQASALHSILNA